MQIRLSAAELVFLWLLIIPLANVTTLRESFERTD
jgi:hypothetical protein